jgi:hypothetical protein
MYVLVLFLDDVFFQYTGKHLDRSKESERFVARICKIINKEVANRNKRIKDSEIRAAIRIVYDEMKLLLDLYKQLYGCAFRFDYDAQLSERWLEELNDVEDPE